MLREGGSRPGLGELVSAPLQTHPDYHHVIAEIGINHNGSLDLALELIQMASDAGCDFVKFQKRSPDHSVPIAQREIARETPWGVMTYLDYKHRIELRKEDYQAIDSLTRRLGIGWSASAWDLPSLQFLDGFDLAFHKVASAMARIPFFLEEIAQRGQITLMSTGALDWNALDAAVETFRKHSCPLVLMHSVPLYPCPPEELNLLMITQLRERYGLPVGYSGHEAGVSPSVVAGVLGASVIERHFTKSRAIWGTDQAASLEYTGMRSLVGSLRHLKMEIGNGDRSVSADMEKKLQTLIPPESAFPSRTSEK